MASAMPPRPLFGPTLAALVAFAILIALGTWQLQRKAWKEGLIAALTQRVSAAPAALPPPEQWAELTQNADEFRHVKFRAEFLPGQEALVYTSGSTLRPDVRGPGYWVMAPARLPGGATIVVNRGFVPEGRQDAATRREGEPQGGEVTGALRWPDSPNWFVGESDQAHTLWFVRDPGAMASARHWGPVAPFYVEQEAPVPPGGLPKPGPLQPTLPNNHLQYALTWYGLAVVLVIGFGFWVWGAREERLAEKKIGRRS